MESNLQTGMKYEFSFEVDYDDSAEALGSGDILVLSTPVLVAGLERAAMLDVAPCLPPGYTTVGIRVDIEHCAATPIGMKVTMQAELTEIDGRRLTFSVNAYDGLERIGGGQHERFIIETERFMKKVNKKIMGDE